MLINGDNDLGEPAVAMGLSEDLILAVGWRVNYYYEFLNYMSID